MAARPSSKYAVNPFLSVTANRYPLMREILADTVPRAKSAAGGLPEFAPVLLQLTAAADAWFAGDKAIMNAEAALPAASQALDAKMDSFCRRPNSETNSLLEAWTAIVRSEVPYLGSLYRKLLPQGRQTLTRGTREQQLDALSSFAIRLADQSAKPVLVALGGTVSGFATAARALRTAQTLAKSNLEKSRQAQEPLRVAAAGALLALIGQGMVSWHHDPTRIDTLWDVNLLRRPPRQPVRGGDIPVPTAP